MKSAHERHEELTGYTDFVKAAACIDAVSARRLLIRAAIRKDRRGR
jgi:hypothetical protein